MAPDMCGAENAGGMVKIKPKRGVPVSGSTLYRTVHCVSEFSTAATGTIAKCDANGEYLTIVNIFRNGASSSEK